MSDEGLHEIQLNGKQLVFLFMAATVVAVVIFLCGVMVGRGVPTRAASAIDVSGQAVLDPTAVVQETPPPRAVAGTGGAPVTAQETLTYPFLLEDPDPPAETPPSPFEPVAAAPVVAQPPAAVASELTPATPSAAAVVTRPRPVAPPSAAAPPLDVARPPASVGPVIAAADVTLAEPPGTGFVVQVAAARQRAEADTVARRLRTKGYPAFVTAAGVNFRVRVGKYRDRREAESVAGRLEEEEQFKPWITQ